MAVRSPFDTGIWVLGLRSWVLVSTSAVSLPIERKPPLVESIFVRARPLQDNLGAGVVGDLQTARGQGELLAQGNRITIEDFDLGIDPAAVGQTGDPTDGLDRARHGRPAAFE